MGVYKITELHVVSGKYCTATNMLIADKQGRLLTTEVEQEARWAEHFCQQSSEQISTKNWSRSTESWYWPTCQHHTTWERKTQGSHQIPQKRKSYRTGQPQHRTLQDRARVCSTSSSATLCSNMREKTTTLYLTTGRGVHVIVKIPKKGALSNCTNWGGVTLLSTCIPAWSLPSSSSGGSLKQWTSDSHKSKQVFKKNKDTQARSSLCTT